MHTTTSWLAASFRRLALLTVVACATTSKLAPVTGSSTDIEAVEIRGVLWRAQTAADVVRILRPAMLMERDVSRAYYADAVTGVPHQILVYQDGSLAGTVDVLSTIPAKAILRLERLTPSAALMRLGVHVDWDIILVTTHAPPSPSPGNPLTPMTLEINTGLLTGQGAACILIPDSG